MDNTKFSINGKSLKLNTSEDVNEMILEINSKPNLQEICLSGNTIGVEAAIALASALINKFELKLVQLNDIFTGRLRAEIPICLDAFASALKDKTKLEILDLSDNAFGPAGATPLIPLLSTNHNIKILKLNNCGLGIEGVKIISQALESQLKKCIQEEKITSLTILQIGRNRMENKGVEYLSDTLKKMNETILEIYMPQNSIRPEGITYLMNNLKYCEKLKVLDLQDNTFTKIGSISLSETIKSWKNLNQLNINDCLMGKEGSKKVISSIIESTTTLTKLNLTFNEIDKNCVELIPILISKNKNLEQLELNGNCFDPDSDIVETLRNSLLINGYSNALDTLDEMEIEENDNQESENKKNTNNHIEIEALRNAVNSLKLAGK